VLQAMGGALFTRGWVSDEGDRAAVFSHLIRATHPGKDDPPGALSAAVREGRIPTERWIEAAFYAPQWARHVEEGLGWPQFEEAVWWIYAHARDAEWSEDEDDEDTPRQSGEPWAARLAERT